MTNPIINPQPNYSGVTIQITNPAVNVGRNGGYEQAPTNNNVAGNMINNPYQTATYPTQGYPSQLSSIPQQQIYQTQPANIAQQPAYPPQYYLNNYNYQTTAPQERAQSIPQEAAVQGQADSSNSNQYDSMSERNSIVEANKKPEDMTKSNGIINDLDERDAQLKADKKDTKQKRVVALTDEYIKSLENYLNNPNDEIRLMASKEILTRLDEDKNRYDDAALNALLNKMLQDPSKLIRVAALSAFSSQLACGNDYTVQLLQNIQTNPNADKEDVLQAADILLKMSAGTEVRDIPNPAVKEAPKDATKGQ